jgi:endonuclease/exonuclease/phosphatase family metal-dependent hydrolase
LNLITWNIQWCRGCDGRVSPTRIVKTLREMADFDVLCLQEVARNYPGLAGSAGEDQYETLAGLLGDYTVVKGVAVDALAPDNNWREFGNCLITRLPILQVFRRLLPWPAEPGVPSMQRSAIEVVLQLRSGPIRVTTTHLEYYSGVQRRAQVKALRELHAEAAGHAADRSFPEKVGGPFEPMPRPVSGIITADFNFPPEDPMYARLGAPFTDGTPALRDAWRVRHGDKPHDPTIGLYDREQWPAPFTCDFIFVSEDLASRVEDVVVNLKTDASDHQPVLLKLKD